MEKMNTISAEDFEKICRACLNESKHMISLYSGENLKMFAACASGQEVSEDKLPNQLCAPCLLDMKDAYDFRLRCIASMDKLIKIIINHKNLSNDEESQDIYVSDQFESQDLELTKNAGNEIKYEKNEIEDISVIKIENRVDSDSENSNGDLLEFDTGDSSGDVTAAANEKQRSLSDLLMKKYNVYGLTCNICKKELSNRFSMVRHMETHNKNRKFKYYCSICKKGFYANENLKKHEQRHFGQTKFQCDECPKRFYVLSALGVHCKSSHKSKPIECSKCSQIFYHQLQMDAHQQQIHVEKIFDCKICKKVFQKRESLTKHKVMHSENRIHTCISCGQSFKRKSELTAHTRRRHEGSQKRDICYKCGKLVLHLSNHLDTHDKSRQLKCPHCHKIYSSNLLLHGHIKYKHDNNAVHQCDICNKALGSRLSLKSHMAKVHTEDFKKYNCPICGKSYRSKGAVNVHLESFHKNKRPYECNTCRKAFHTKQVLEQHIRTHTGEKPFSCDICSKSFVTKTVLKTHMRVHYK